MALLPDESEAEVAILGYIVLGRENSYDPWPAIDKESITLRLFHAPKWKEVFRVLIDRRRQGGGVPTEDELLRELKGTTVIVTNQEVSGLYKEAALPGNIGYYAEKLRANQKLRVIIDVCHRGINTASDIAAGVKKPISQITDLKDQLIHAFEQTTGVPDYESRRFDPAKVPSPLHAVFRIGDIPICTPGNITSIASAVKVGKSGFVEAMVASTMASKVSETDTLGIYSENPAGRAVVHIDSEQSLDDHRRLVDRAIRRARVDHLPDWLRSYCFTGFEAWAAWAALKDCVKRAADEFGGIHSVFLDGFADFVRDVNDPGECNPFVAELQALAGNFYCPIIGVIHFNPGGEKTRGHLGSQIERKSETNLTLEKVDGVTEVWSTKQRRAPILRGTGPRFTWSDQAGMHVSVESGQSSKDKLAIQEELLTRAEVFSERQAMKHGELKKRVQDVAKVSESTAKRRMEKWVRLNIVECSHAGLYIPKDYQ